MTLRLYARAEVVRILHVVSRLLARLEAEEIVESRRGRYTAEDLERIRIAAELADLDVNDAGIEVALRMREQWLAERRELHGVIETLRARLSSHRP